MKKWIQTVRPALLLVALMLAPAAHAAETNFALSFHVFEGLVEAAEQDAEPPARALVEQAVTEASRVLGYQAARPVGTKTWLVRTDGDMERLLDYRGSHLRIMDRADVKFSLVFDAGAHFLTLIDLELSAGNQVLLHTSVGIQDHGAAVAGVIEPGDDGREFFIVLTFDVSDTAFEHQSREATFTVIDDWALSD